MSLTAVVSRRIAIAFGIICIILIVGLVGAIVGYTSMVASKDNAIAARDSQIANMTSQISSLSMQVENLQSTVNDLNNTAKGLNNEVRNLNSLVNLNETEYWVVGESRELGPNSSDTWGRDAQYAGFLEISVTSNATTTYVQVTYFSFYGVNYDNHVVVGAGNTLTRFPVLPAFQVDISVGNTNLLEGASIFVTVTYHY